MCVEWATSDFPPPRHTFSVLACRERKTPSRCWCVTSSLPELRGLVSTGLSHPVWSLPVSLVHADPQCLALFPQGTAFLPLPSSFLSLFAHQGPFSSVLFSMTSQPDFWWLQGSTSFC